MSELLGGFIIGFLLAVFLSTTIIGQADRNRCENGLTFLIDKTVYQCVKFEARPSTKEGE